MKIIVIGAGVIGVTTAYYLNKAGHEVEVYDSNTCPAQGTSFANAGQISVGYSAPWAAPGIPLKAMKWLLSSDSPFAFKFDGTKQQLKWVYDFLKECNKESYTSNKDIMLRLSMYSKECFQELREETNIQYEGRQQGTLQIFRKQQQLLNAQNDMMVLTANNVDFEMITNKNELFNIEPALQNSYADLIGGIYLPGDETGDCNLFTNNLEAICKANGVKFFYNSTVHLIRNGSHGTKIVGVYDGVSMHSADSYVLAAGVGSRKFLNNIDLDIPVYPVRGYSLTLDITNENNSPVSTVLDETNKVAITRFDNRIRVGGFAELGYKSYTNHHGFCRFNQLENIVDELFPDCSQLQSYTDNGWSGLRPMAANGIPFIGECGFDNLYLNTGHGTLGWTMSCGSAKILTDMMLNNTNKMSTTAFKLK
jgi:D-amino-acid dehydrogenase